MTKTKRGPEPSVPPYSEEARRLGEAIARLRDKRDLNQANLAKAVGVKQQTLSKIERGRTNPDNPQARHTITKIAEFLGSTFGLDWLHVLTQVPVIAYVAGGKPIVEDIHDEFIGVDPHLIKLTEDTCGLKVRGESMIDEHILDGDVLICRRASPDNVPKGRIVVIDLKGERGAAVKRFQRKQGMIYLYSDKYATDEDKMKFHDWEAGKIFEVVGLIRRVT